MKFTFCYHIHNNNINYKKSFLYKASLLKPIFMKEHSKPIITQESKIKG